MGRMFQDERQAQGRSWAGTDLGHWRADGSQWGRNTVSAGEWPRGGRREDAGGRGGRRVVGAGGGWIPREEGCGVMRGDGVGGGRKQERWGEEGVGRTE